MATTKWEADRRGGRPPRRATDRQIGAGYVACGCRDCMETAIGAYGALCHACESAGCDPDEECCADGAYGTEEA
jgi:hypothetical protein